MGDYVTFDELVASYGDVEAMQILETLEGVVDLDRITMPPQARLDLVWGAMRARAYA